MRTTTPKAGPEITPEMIEAGVYELVRYYPEDNDDQDAEDRRFRVLTVRQIPPAF